MKPAPKFNKSTTRLCALVGLATLATQAWTQTYYSLTLLNTPAGYTASVGRYITDTDLILVNSHIQQGAAGAFTLIPSLPGTTSTPTPNWMNASGKVVGTARNSASVFKSFYYDGTTTVELPSLGATFRSDAYGINDAGVIVGEARTGSATSTRRAVKWVGGVLQDLTGGLLTNQVSFAYGINNLGQVVGAGRMAGDTSTHPLYFANPGAPIKLPKLPGDDRGQAFGISDNGIIVGQSSRLTLDTVQAAKWDISGLTVTPLTQPVGFDGYWVASDVNNAGTAVGTTTNLNFFTRAAVYQNNIGYNLNWLLVNPIPGFEMIVASQINESGKIIGYGQLNGVNTGYVLEPVATATAVAPINYTITLGTPFGGTLASLLSSDDDKVFILNDENDPNAAIEIIGSGAPTPTTLVNQQIETSSTRDDMSEFHEVWSNLTNSWSNVGSRVTTLADSYLQVYLPGPATQWVSPTGEIKSRIRWIPNQDLEAADGWSETVDHVRWEII